MSTTNENPDKGATQSGTARQGTLYDEVTALLGALAGAAPLQRVGVVSRFNLEVAVRALRANAGGSLTIELPSGSSRNATIVYNGLAPR